MTDIPARLEGSVSIWSIAPGEDRSTAPRIFLLVVLPLIILLLRTPSFVPRVVDEDEAIYAVIANQILDGGAAYRDAAENKPPLTYYYYVAVFALFGKGNILAIHLCTVVWVWMTALVLAKWAAEAFDRRAGPLAAALYAVFTTTSYVKILAANSELLGALPLVLGMLFGLRALRRSKGLLFLLSGVFFGLAILFKQQLAFGPLAIAFPLLLSKQRPFSRRILLAGALGAGGLLPIAAVAGFFAWKHAFHDFVYWSFLRNFTYVAAGYATVDFWHRFAVRTGLFLGATAICWVWSYRTLRASREAEQRGRQVIAILLLWVAGALLATMVGGRLYGHYYLMLVPPAVLLASPAAARTWHEAGHGPNRVRATLAIMLLVALPATGFLAASMNAKRVMRYFGESVPDYSHIARFVAAQNPARAPIFVWGFAPTIYLLSGANPASRFSSADYLTGRITGSPASHDPHFDSSQWAVPGSWSMLLADFQKTPPSVIVDTASSNLHDYGKYPISQYPLLEQYVREHYMLAGVVDGVRVYRRGK